MLLSWGHNLSQNFSPLRIMKKHCLKRLKNGSNRMHIILMFSCFMVQSQKYASFKVILFKFAKNILLLSEGTPQSIIESSLLSCLGLLEGSSCHKWAYIMLCISVFFGKKQQSNSSGALGKGWKIYWQGNESDLYSRIRQKNPSSLQFVISGQGARACCRNPTTRKPIDLKATNHLYSFLSGFRLGFGTKMALVALVDDLRHELDGAECGFWYHCLW